MTSVRQAAPSAARCERKKLNTAVRANMLMFSPRWVLRCLIQENPASSRRKASLGISAEKGGVLPASSASPAKAK